jgi:foldase protein PrsA
MKHITTIVPAILALGAVGCAGTDLPTTIESRRKDPAPTTRPASANAPAEKPMAKVNGQTLPMAPLVDALLNDYGLQASQQFIADALVRQELERRNIDRKITAEDIHVENVRALSKIFQFETVNPTQKQMDAVLDQLLARKNLTRRVWDQTMRRNARLAKLAARRVQITEDDLRNAFFTEYDGKFRCRHIQVPDAATTETVLAKAKNGADFEQLAFQYSTHPDAKSGAFLPPIGPRTAPPEVPPVLVEAVRALEEPGQLSNIVQVGSNFHILKLEAVEPPTDVDFDEVKPQLRQTVRDQKIDRLQHRIMRELIHDADIEFLNPVLKTQYHRARKP